MISVEKAAVLVNDGLVIGVRFLTNYTRAMHNIILFYLLKGLLTLNFDCVLHEGGEDLGELDFGALLSLITIQFLLDELLVKAGVKQRDCPCLVQFRYVLKG